MTAWAQKLDRKVGGRRPPLQCIATTLTKQVPPQPVHLEVVGDFAELSELQG